MWDAAVPGPALDLRGCGRSSERAQRSLLGAGTFFSFIPARGRRGGRGWPWVVFACSSQLSPHLCRPCSGFWARSKHGAALRERWGGCLGSLQAASPFQQPPQRFLRCPCPSVQTLLRPEGGRRTGAQPVPYPSLQARHLCGQGWLLLLAQPLSLAIKTLPWLWTCSSPSSPHLCSGYHVFQGSFHWRLCPVSLSPCQPPLNILVAVPWCGGGCEMGLEAGLNEPPLPPGKVAGARLPSARCSWDPSAMRSLEKASERGEHAQQSPSELPQADHLLKEPCARAACSPRFLSHSSTTKGLRSPCLRGACRAAALCPCPAGLHDVPHDHVQPLQLQRPPEDAQKPPPPRLPRVRGEFPPRQLRDPPEGGLPALLPEGGLQVGLCLLPGFCWGRGCWGVPGRAGALLGQVSGQQVGQELGGSCQVLPAGREGRAAPAAAVGSLLLVCASACAAVGGWLNPPRRPSPASRSPPPCRCPSCAVVFGGVNSIKSHIQTSHCEVFHKCPICPMAFKSAPSAHAHVYTQHPGFSNQQSK